MVLEGDDQTNEAERIEALRLILESEQGRPVAYNEAREIGASLMNFFEALAGDIQDEPDNPVPHRHTDTDDR